MASLAALAAAIKAVSSTAAASQEAQRKAEDMLSKLACNSEKLLDLKEEQEIESSEVVLTVLRDLLQAFAACAGRHTMHARQLTLASAANRLLAQVERSGGVDSSADRDVLLELVATIRRKIKCKRPPTKPVVCVSLISAHMAQLEAGVNALTVKKAVLEGGRAVSKMIIGGAKSVLMMKLDASFLEGTQDLLKAGSDAARRTYARPAYQELLHVDLSVLGRKRPRPEETNKRCKLLFQLQERHFSTYALGRWELKASTVWAMTEVGYPLTQPLSVAPAITRSPWPRFEHLRA